jgi:MFS family permease
MRDEQTILEIRQARGKFASMLVAYSLGVFNDNFFRQSAMLIAVALGMKDKQGLLLVVFTLPYLLFASQAGWLADRFSKRRVIIGSKFLELLAMIFGAAGLLTASWMLILSMVFVMGLQSAVFNPSLNGSIPELYPASYVRTAYAIVKGIVTAMILIGVAVSGAVLRNKSEVIEGLTLGRSLAAGIVVVVSLVGLIGGFGVPRRPAADPRKKFPWAGPVHTVARLLEMRKDPLLAKAIVLNSFIWFIGALIMPVINVLGDREHFGDEAVPSLLIAAELVGIVGGGLLTTRVARGDRWHRVLAPATMLMTVSMAAMACTALLPKPAQLPAMFAVLAAIGVFGGMCMVLCEAFFQIRPPAGSKGTVIASANCASFIGVLAAGIVSGPMVEYFSPAGGFAVMAFLVLPMAVWLRLVLPKVEIA